MIGWLPPPRVASVVRAPQPVSPSRAGGFFDEGSAFQAHDAVGDMQRLRSMRHHQGRSAVRQPLDCGHHGQLALAIEGTGRFVEQQYWGVFEEGAGQVDALLFTDAQSCGSIADPRIIPLR